MSRKNLVQSYEMFTASTQPPGSSSPKFVDATIMQTSKATNVETSDNATIHIKFSSANSGEVVVQARNLAANSSEPEKAWYSLSFGGATTIVSETDVQILLNTLPFTEIRLIWNPSAGAGTVSAFLNMKSVGA